MNYHKTFACLFLIVWYFFFTANKIDLTTADLGRHLKTGELIWQGWLNNKGVGDKTALLKTNFYSYTQPEFPVINHHWGSGLIFFLIYKIGGFWLLSVFYLGLVFLAFYLLFRVATNYHPELAFLVSLPLIPLISEREEVRPEAFGYFFGALFFWLLWRFKEKKLKAYWLYLLPLIEPIWVNTHITFFLGPFLIGVFLLERLISNRKDFDKIAKLALVLCLTAATTLINPSGLNSVLYPLNIFQNYGYKIVENQSVWFLENLGIFKNPNLLIFKITFVFLLLSFILVFFLKRQKFLLSYFLLASAFSVLAWLAIRNFTLFALFSLPILTYNLQTIISSFASGPRFKEEVTLVLALTILIFICLCYQSTFNLRINRLGLGLKEANNASADFFKTNQLQGPILNNYDIGGYLIYHLFPEGKVFVDNRPEAYTEDFFKKVYIPLQENPEAWQKEKEQWRFNVIFYSHKDATPWGQNFLINRIKDPEWAPVFADQYAIIFLKRTPLNQEIIEKYELPKEFFKVSKR